MGGHVEYQTTKSQVSAIGEVDPINAKEEAKTKFNLEDLIDKLAGIVVFHLQ